MATTTLIPHRKTRLPDDANAFDVTETLVVPVDADRTSVCEALERLPLTNQATRSLHALGVADRLALEPTPLKAGPDSALLIGLVWRVEGPATKIELFDLETLHAPGHIMVTWDLGVSSSAAGGSYIAITTRFATTDEVTRARLHAGWSLIGPLATTLTHQTLATVKAYAENDDQLDA